MMLRALQTGFLLLIMAFTASAQSALQVSVSDKDNDQPVAFAYVNVYNGSKLVNTVQTTENGAAALTINTIPCTIKVIIAGYETYSFAYDSSALGQSTLQVNLQKNYSTLNEVVVTGVPKPVKLRDALSNYQVIPRAVIQAQGATTLNDVLNKQLNMSVAGNDDILGPSIRMQGMGGDKVKILMDGMPVNGREGGNINLSQISMNNVERIEIIQGPMSVIYGTEAIGGIINVITKDDHKPFEFHAGTYLTTVNKYNADGSVSFAINKRNQVSIGGGRNFFEGWKNTDSPLSYHGDTLKTSRCFLFKPLEQYFGNLVYSYSAPSHFKLRFASDGMQEKLTDKGQVRVWDPFAGAYATDQYFYTNRLNNRLSLHGDLGQSGHWTMQNSFAYYHRIRKTVNTNLVNMEQNLTPNEGDQDTSAFYDYSFRSGYSNNIQKLKYTLGYDFNLQYVNSLKLTTRTAQIQDYALYADLSYPLVADKLTANAGLRGAYNTKYNPPLIPAFNLLYTPYKNTQIRASYSQAYRAPYLKEMYLDFVDVNHDIHGNPNLKAESSSNVQLSGSYQAIEKADGYLQFIVTGYYNDIHNQITLVKDDTLANNRYHYQNYAHLQNLIGNLQVDGQYYNLHAVVGYSYIHNFSAGNSYDPYGASEITGTLQYAWRKPGVNFNLFYKFTGAQPFIYIDSYTNEAIPNGRQQAYSICDASIEKKFYNKKLQIIAGVKNIFDVQAVKTSGVTLSGPHGGGNGAVGNMLPRSLFTAINVNLN